MKLPYDRVWLQALVNKRIKLSSTKEEHFFDYLSDYQLLQNNSCPYS
jgi:hypothetical protein